MDLYEYKKDFIKADNLDHNLNAYGKMGYQIVYCQYSVLSESYSIIFCRKVEKQGD